MLEKELLYEYAIKAMERFESKKISIFGNGYVESLDENNRFVERDLSKDKDYETWVLNSIEEGNGIFIVMGQFVIDYCGSFEDITDTDFVFDDRYYEEGYLDSLYREYYGFDDEDMYDEPIDEEDYDFEDEPEAVSFYIDAEHGVSAACSVDYFPPNTDFICHVGINLCKEGNEYHITPGYAYLPEVGALDPRMTYEDWPITKESIEDDPIEQLFAVVLDSNLSYEGEEEGAYNEWSLENLLERIHEDTVTKDLDVKFGASGNEFEKEAEELLKAGKISNYFEHFEKLNSATDSIYDLGDNEVLIILKDGTNLTSWDNVSNQHDILYISEDFSNRKVITRKYRYLTSLKATVVVGITKKIKDMEEMFQGCSSLVDLYGLETWDTSKIEKMEGMFRGCSSLEDISGLENWDISNAYRLWNLFDGCSSLTDLSPLANWDISDVSSMADMFSGCSSLVDLSPLKDWDTSNVRNMSRLFSGCSSLADLSPLEKWNISSVRKIDSIFGGCSSLVDLSPLKDWDTSQIKSMVHMFGGCSSLTGLSGLEYWNTSKLENMQGIFSDCASLTDLSSLENWNTSKVNNMWSVFEGCSSLVDLSPLSGWNVSHVTAMRYIFEGCSSLISLSGLENWDIHRVSDMIAMFKCCSSLTDLSSLKSWNLSPFNQDLSGMFKFCSSLSDLSPLSSWDVSGVFTMKNMFKGCSSLSDLSQLSSWDVSKFLENSGIFDDCPSIEVYPNWYENNKSR